MFDMRSNFKKPGLNH